MIYNNTLLSLIKDITPELYNAAYLGKDIRTLLEDMLDKTKLTDLEIINMKHEDILTFALKRHNLQTVYDTYMDNLLEMLDNNTRINDCVN